MTILLAVIGALVLFAAPSFAGTTVRIGSPVNTISVTPANPTGTTSTASDVMMGLAIAFTPAVSGNLLIVVSGDLTNTTAGNGARAQIQYGTGSAPANGDASTGTSCGQRINLTRVASNNDAHPFALNCIATGLTVGTAYWIDLRAAAITGGTGAPSTLAISASELP